MANILDIRKWLNGELGMLVKNTECIEIHAKVKEMFGMKEVSPSS